MVKKSIALMFILALMGCGEDTPTSPTSPSVSPIVTVATGTPTPEDSPTVHEEEPAPEIVDPVNTPLYTIVGPGGCLDYAEYEWTVTVNEEGYRLRTASFHENDAGCTQTTRKGGGAFEILSEINPGPTTFEWHGNQACGRYQADIAIGDEATENFETIVGVVINTGVDCVAEEIVEEEPEEPEVEEPEVEEPEEPEAPKTQGPPVGARLNSYSPPSLCSTIVSFGQSIQTAADSAIPANGDICINPSYTGSGDATAIRLEIPGTRLMAMFRGITLHVPVVISESDVVVSGFSFSGISGDIIRVDANASRFTIRSNSITGIGTSGICIFTATAGVFGNSTIENNSINNCRTGIYTEDHLGTITIKHNDIYDHVAGIGDLSGAIVQENEFSRNQEAIGYDLDFDPNPAVVNYNNFLTNGDIKNYSSNSILDAENNYFEKGGENQTVPNLPLGDIDYTPEYDLRATHR